MGMEKILINNDKPLFTKKECLEIISWANLQVQWMDNWDPYTDDYVPMCSKFLRSINHFDEDDKYKWMYDRVLDWGKSQNLGIKRLGTPELRTNWFMINNYPVGTFFKPHSDRAYLFKDLSEEQKKLKGSSVESIEDKEHIRVMTFVTQLSEESDYEGGEVQHDLNSTGVLLNDGDNKNIITKSKEIGHTHLHSCDLIHWVNPITSGNRWSLQIFLEEDSFV